MAELPEASTPPIDRGPKYRRRLLQMLATATFFNGYDGFVLAFALPLILANLGGSEAQGGLVFLIVNFGEVVAFLLAVQADRIGRRRLLLTTIIGYTVATLATAASPNLATLTAAQFVARIFLGAEWAVAISIVVEDLRVDGTVLTGVAGLLRSSGHWRVVTLDPALSSLKVPSEGGERFAGAPPSLWLLGLAIAGLLVALSAALMRLVGGRPVESPS